MRYPFLKNFGRYPVIPVVLGRSSASRKKQAGGGLSRAPVRRRRGPLTGRCLLARLNSRRASVDYKRVRGREDAPDSKGGRRLWWGCRGEAHAPRRAPCFDTQCQNSYGVTFEKSNKTKLYLAIRLLKRTDTRRVSISALLSQIRPYGAVAP